MLESRNCMHACLYALANLGGVGRDVAYGTYYVTVVATISRMGGGGIEERVC